MGECMRRGTARLIHTCAQLLTSYPRCLLTPGGLTTLPKILAEMSATDRMRRAAMVAHTREPLRSRDLLEFIQSESLTILMSFLRPAACCRPRGGGHWHARHGPDTAKGASKIHAHRIQVLDPIHKQAVNTSSIAFVHAKHEIILISSNFFPSSHTLTHLISCHRFVVGPQPPQLCLQHDR